MKNLLKLHENLVIFPLKFSQDFHGFWFHSDRISRNFEPWAELVQVTQMLQEDQVIQEQGDEGHSGEWMQDGKLLDG